MFRLIGLKMLVARVLVLVAAITSLSHVAQGQTLEVGQTVVVTEQAQLLTLNGEKLSLLPGLPLVVEKVKVEPPSDNSPAATRVLVSNGTPGWLDARNVMTPAKALKYFDAKIAAEPDANHWPIARAMTLAAMQQHEAAIKEFSRLLELDPNNVSCLNERAGSYIAQGDFKRALVDFDSLISNEPKAEFYNNRAFCRVAMKNWAGARADFEAALKLDPDFSAVYLGLGKLEERLGNVDAAITNFSMLIERVPNDVTGYLERAGLYVDQRKYEETLADLEKALELEPGDEAIHRNRGIVLSNMGKPDEALVAFTEMIERFPNSPTGYVNRGVLYENEKQPEKALADFDQFLKHSPDHPFGLFRRGCVKMTLKQYESAIKDLTQAIEQQPKTIALLRRGEAYRLSGKPRLATKDFEQVKANDPKHEFTDEQKKLIQQGEDDKGGK